MRALVLLVLMAVLPGSAEASSCLESVDPAVSGPPVPVAPAGEGVALNTWVWLRDSRRAVGFGDVEGGPEVLLESEAGEVVELDIRLVLDTGSQTLIGLQPRALLEEETGYLLSLPETGGLPLSFSTGFELDEEAPARPVVEAVEAHTDDYFTYVCDGWDDWVRFELAPVEGRVLLALEQDVEDLDDPQVPVASFDRSEEVLYEGRAQPGQVLRVRFASIDHAGNFSGWGETEEVLWPLAGCTCSSGGASGGLLLMPLVLVARRRRGRRVALRRPGMGLLLSGLVLLLAVPRPAAALSCDDDDSGGDLDDYGLVAPRGEGVPLDALIWVVAGPGEFRPSAGWTFWGVSVEPAGGHPVVLELQHRIEAPQQILVGLRPQELLAPGTEYSVELAGTTATTGTSTGSFVTGTGTDDEAPAVPERLDVEIHSDDYVTGPCDGWEDWARFEVGSAGFVDLMADDEQVFDSEEPDSPLVDMSLSGELAWSGRAQPGTELRVRFATLDVAGNFSGWSEVEPVPWPLAGCTCDAGGQAAGLALLPLLLLVARRRRGAGGVLLLLVLLALPTSASADPSHFAEDWARDLSVDAQEEARRLAIVGAVGTPLCATNAIFVGLRVPVAAELLPGCLIGFIPVWVAAASFSVLSRDVLRLGAATKGWAGLGIGFGVPMAVVGGVMAFLIPAATWTPEAAIPGLAISVAGHALIFSALGTVDLVTRYQAGARTINRPIALSPAGITIRF